MAAITEKDILTKKEEAQEIRDKIISAKSTLESVKENIEEHKKELKKLGVKEGEEEKVIQDLEEEIKSIYEEASKLIEQWKEKIE